MISSIKKFKIPTILGLGLIMAGITAGVFLVTKDQGFFTKASPNLTAQDITISNISDTAISISWQTASETTSFISFGTKEPLGNTLLDDRDQNTPKVRSIHYVTIKNLQPETSYLFKIISGKVVSDIKNFKTAKSASFQNGFGPIIGSAFDSNDPLDQAVVYLSIPGASIQSAVVKDLGNFLIPISLMQQEDLSDTFQPKEGEVGKLTIIAPTGQSNALFQIKSEGVILPPISLGQTIDLTSVQTDTSSSEVSKLDKFDLNNDRQINAIDYSEVLLNFGPLREASKNPKNQKADLNRDGVVDTSDLEEITKVINQ